MRRPVAGVRADDGEKDLLESGLLLDVLDLCGWQELLQLGEGAVGDNPPFVENGDPVGEVLDRLSLPA
jgi:hypothetical protein